MEQPLRDTRDDHREEEYASEEEEAADQRSNVSVNILRELEAISNYNHNLSHTVPEPRRYTTSPQKLGKYNTVRTSRSPRSPIPSPTLSRAGTSGLRGTAQTNKLVGGMNRKVSFVDLYDEQND